MQDTYLKAFRFQSRFERGTNLKAWLFTILHNTWRNARRAHARDPIAVDSEAVERAHGWAGGAVAFEVVRAAVARARERVRLRGDARDGLLADLLLLDVLVGDRA